MSYRLTRYNAFMSVKALWFHIWFIYLKIFRLLINYRWILWFSDKRLCACMQCPISALKFSIIKVNKTLANDKVCMCWAVGVKYLCYLHKGQLSDCMFVTSGWPKLALFWKQVGMIINKWSSFNYLFTYLCY